MKAIGRRQTGAIGAIRGEFAARRLRRLVDTESGVRRRPVDASSRLQSREPSVHAKRQLRNTRTQIGNDGFTRNGSLAFGNQRPHTLG